MAVIELIKSTTPSGTLNWSVYINGNYVTAQFSEAAGLKAYERCKKNHKNKEKPVTIKIEHI